MSFWKALLVTSLAAGLLAVIIGIIFLAVVVFGEGITIGCILFLGFCAMVVTTMGGAR